MDATKTPSTVVVVALTAAALLLRWKWPLLRNVLRRLLRRSRSDDPSLPPVAPVSIRETLTSLFGGRDGPLFLLGLSRRVGPVYRLPVGPGCGIVVVGDHVAARTILDDPMVGKPRFPYRLFDRVAGTSTSFFTDDGLRWRHVRRATAAAFVPGRVGRMRRIVRAQVDRIVAEEVDPAARTGEPIDVVRAMQRITARVIAEAGFEYEMTDGELDVLLRSFHNAYLEYGRAAALNPLRAIFPRLFPGAREAKRASSDLRSLAGRVLRAYRAARPEKKADGGGTIVSALVEDSEYASDEERISDMIIFLVAGFDSLAHTLSWALLELARNPEEQNYLQEQLPCNASSKGDPQPRALQNVIRETLRLHPAAAVGSARSLSRDVTFGRYTLPKGTGVLIPYFAMQRNEAVFEDPDSFQPRRWEEPGREARLNAIMPFSTGRRNCLGRALAMAEMNVVLARLCADFEFSVAKEGTYDYFVTWKTVGTMLFAKRRK